MSIIVKRQEIRDKKWLAGLASFDKFGFKRITRLLNFFPDEKTAFEASFSDLRKAGIEEKIAEEFIHERRNINPEKIIAELDQEKIKMIILGEKDYPEILGQIASPPFIIYLKGEIEVLRQFNIAIVGSRKVSSYGRQATEDIATNLAGAGVNIISGLALGVDTIAHESTISGNGKTIAVLGSGILKSVTYPAQNRKLAEKIADGFGAVISEFPPHEESRSYFFPQRNRIVAGLSRGVVVVEAAEKSGALITARMALDENREVFAVPGSIYSPLSAGTNKLIKEGACVVSNGQDVLDALGFQKESCYIENKCFTPESEEERLVFEALSREPKHINDIIRSSGLPPEKASSALSLMEIKGLARNMGGMEYIRI